ncbi:MAG: YcjX family protein [Tateyamaria sp.]|uniref:YcjX family protein n=1 Tax=Tateyamaria sp. TaxID=1929288 RepID=UPI0032A079F8
MVLTTIADSVLDVAQGIYDTGSDLVGTPTIRLGVTGLARSGKTVFITSLVANLLDRGRMPHLLAAREGRIAAAYLQTQPDDTVPRFDFETHMGALTGTPPRWPESTRAVSELRVSLRVKPNGLLAGLQGPRTIHLDIIDYPGEWLLDLGLMDQTYEEWSAATLKRLETRSVGAAYLALAKDTDGAARLDEVQAKTLSQTFTDYLNAARGAGFYDCTPGRFLLPGDLAGSPVLTFAPLPASDDPRQSLRREMVRRFEAYKAQVVRPFFRDHFSRIDRQVVLVDALGAIHNGPAAVEDMRGAMTDILGAFKPGRNAFLTKLFRGKRVEKILFAATKADHLHHAQHGRLTAIMAALTREARDRARFAGAETEALALASLRATTEDTMTHAGTPLDVVRGTLLDTGKQAAFYPGALPDDPAHILSAAKGGADKWLDEDYQVMRFAPAPLTLRPGDGPPHMRMDRAAQFLIGDKL